MKTATVLIYVVCFLFITYASNIDTLIGFKLLIKLNQTLWFSSGAPINKNMKTSMHSCTKL